MMPAKYSCVLMLFLGTTNSQEIEVQGGGDPMKEEGAVTPIPEEPKKTIVIGSSFHQAAKERASNMP